MTRTRRRELTHEFIVSYMLWAGGGFVGYREQKAVTVSDASTPRPCELTFRTGSNVPTRDCTEQPKQSEGEKARTMELLREPLKPRVQPAVAGGRAAMLAQACPYHRVPAFRERR